MSDAQILMYNFKASSRLDQIRKYLNRANIEIRTVQPPQYLEPLGFLFELPGFSKNGTFNLGQNFSEEMIVMKDFDEKQLQDFLGFFKTESLERISLKAVLTPVNSHWNSMQLYQELCKERAAFSRK